MKLKTKEGKYFSEIGSWASLLRIILFVTVVKVFSYSALTFLLTLLIFGSLLFNASNIEKAKRFVNWAEEKELGIKLGTIALIIFVTWMIFFDTSHLSEEEYRGGYGGSDYLD